jgi:hypothetical protein
VADRGPGRNEPGKTGRCSKAKDAFLDGHLDMALQSWEVGDSRAWHGQGGTNGFEVRYIPYHHITSDNGQATHRHSTGRANETTTPSGITRPGTAPENILASRSSFGIESPLSSASVPFSDAAPSQRASCANLSNKTLSAKTVPLCPDISTTTLRCFTEQTAPADGRIDWAGDNLPSEEETRKPFNILGKHPGHTFCVTQSSSWKSRAALRLWSRHIRHCRRGVVSGEMSIRVSLYVISLRYLSLS